MRNTRAMRLEFGAIGEDRLLDGIVRAHVYIAAGTRDVNDRWTAALQVDIAFRHHVLHRVVRFEQHGAFVGGQCPVRLFDARILQSGLSGRLLNCGTGTGDDRGMLAGGDEVNISLQQKFIALGIVVRAFGRSVGLGRCESSQPRRYTRSLSSG